LLTAEILVRLNDGAPPDQLDGPLSKEEERIQQLLSGASVRVAMSMVHHREVADAAGEALGAFDELVSLGGLPPAYARVPLDAFDAVLEVQVPDQVGTARLIDCLQGMVAHLDADVDLTRSCALIGVEHTIIEGDGPVQLFYAFRRIPSISDFKSSLAMLAYDAT
jgi:hypothetical protein